MEKFIIGTLFLVALSGWILYMYKKIKKIEVPHTENGLKEALKDSDDYLLWESVFIKASESLIKKGIFTIEDFQWSSGWVRSTNKLLKYPYFMAPRKGATVKNMVYLDVITEVLYYSYNGKTKYIRFGKEDS